MVGYSSDHLSRSRIGSNIQNQMQGPTAHVAFVLPRSSCRRRHRSVQKVRTGHCGAGPGKEGGQRVSERKANIIDFQLALLPPFIPSHHPIAAAKIIQKCRRRPSTTTTSATVRTTNRHRRRNTSETLNWTMRATDQRSAASPGLVTCATNVESSAMDNSRVRDVLDMTCVNIREPCTREASPVALPC